MGAGAGGTLETEARKAAGPPRQESTDSIRTDSARKHLGVSQAER